MVVITSPPGATSYVIIYIQYTFLPLACVQEKSFISLTFFLATWEQWKQTVNAALRNNLYKYIISATRGLNKSITWGHGRCRLQCLTTAIAEENLSGLHNSDRNVDR